MGPEANRANRASRAGAPGRRVTWPMDTLPDPLPDPTDLHLQVLAWYADHARDLPWRRSDATPWGVLVSEIMLQQTPVGRVTPVWEEWMRTWPTPADLA